MGLEAAVADGGYGDWDCTREAAAKGIARVTRILLAPRVQSGNRRSAVKI